MHIVSYIHQLEDMAFDVGIPLKAAFAAAMVPESTFYRVQHGQDLRLDTAMRIAKAIREWNHNGQHGNNKLHSHESSHA